MSLKVKTESPRIYLHHAETPAPNPKNFESHCHAYYEVIYVVRGRGSYIVEGTEYPLLPNTVLLLAPYEYHYVCPDQDCPYERYVLNFDDATPFDAPRTLAPFANDKSVTGVGIYFSAERVDEALRHTFESFDTLERFLEEKEYVITSEGLVLLRSMITQMLLLLGTAHAEPPTLPQRNLVSDVIAYINANLSAPLSLEELSRRFFVSKYHLCRAFRQYTGNTFLSYVTTKRILLAQRLIESGEAATEVAYRVGFRDYSAFYRAYRKQTGHAPAWERQGSCE
ncbi:MAG: helix-turn-helix transcriptional regulator [Clostridia bacterium]|nr:helix-turn-helix transcriptional regulator [Clostridia bacterium]